MLIRQKFWTFFGADKVDVGVPSKGGTSWDALCGYRRWEEDGLFCFVSEDDRAEKGPGQKKRAHDNHVRHSAVNVVLQSLFDSKSERRRWGEQ